MKLTPQTPCFVFDVESIGLYGEHFAVGGGVYVNGEALNEFKFACRPGRAEGSESNRAWIDENVPVMKYNCADPDTVLQNFWYALANARAKHGKDLIIACECAYPVETNFLAAMIRQDIRNREWQGPYPLIDISSIMIACGFDPLGRFDRRPNELPAHDPLNDARQSARILAQCISGEEVK